MDPRITFTIFAGTLIHDEANHAVFSCSAWLLNMNQMT